MDRYKLDLVTAGRNFNKIRMAVASGFFFHAARKDAQVCVRSPVILVILTMPSCGLPVCVYLRLCLAVSGKHRLSMLQQCQLNCV